MSHATELERLAKRLEQCPDTLSAYKAGILRDAAAIIRLMGVDTDPAEQAREAQAIETLAECMASKPTVLQ